MPKKKKLKFDGKCLIEGEETGYVTASFVMAYLVFIVWLFIYLPIKFFTNMKT